MAHHIPVPAKVHVTVGPYDFGFFEIFPQAVRGSSGLEIVSWSVEDRHHEMRGLFDVLAFTVMKRNMLNRVCERTFENTDCDSIAVQFRIADETWEYHMRAVEKENETVHYEIEIDGEWMDLIDTYVGDIVPEDVYIYAEREVLPSVDFGQDEAVYEQMA